MKSYFKICACSAICQQRIILNYAVEMGLLKERTEELCKEATKEKQRVFQKTLILILTEKLEKMEDLDSKKKRNFHHTMN